MNVFSFINANEKTFTCLTKVGSGKPVIITHRSIYRCSKYANK